MFTGSQKGKGNDQTKKITLKDEPEVITAENSNKQDKITMSRIASAPSLADQYDSAYSHHPALDKRRVSWAFERPEIPSCGEPSLDDMKALLKKQIRSTVNTPDFIYLTVSALKSQSLSTYPYEHSNNQEFGQPSSRASSAAARKPILRHRPQSSPSNIDTKTKVSLTDSLEELLEQSAAAVEDMKSVKSGHTHGAVSSPPRSLRGSLSRNKKPSREMEAPLQRAQSAQAIRVKSAGIPRCQSAESWKTKASRRLPNRTRNGLSTTATEASVVPMLMYPKDGLKPKVDTTRLKKWPNPESIAQHHPINATKSLKLMTYTQQQTSSLAEGKKNAAHLNPAKSKQILCSN